MDSFLKTPIIVFAVSTGAMGALIGILITQLLQGPNIKLNREHWNCTESKTYEDLVLVKIGDKEIPLIKGKKVCIKYQLDGRIPE